MKPWVMCIFLLTSAVAVAQPYPFNGYNIYDYLVTAIHPDGCSSNWVEGLPEDSTWVNMHANSVMTAYFGMQWKDLDGDDLLLESSYHLDNYSVRLILEGGGFSAPVVVDESSWTTLPFMNWKHMAPNCFAGSADAPQQLRALDFGSFGISPEEIVTGIEITFLPTIGEADFAGAYIIVPPCGLFELPPDTTICPGETVNIDATFPNASYLWQDGSTDPVFTNAGPGNYWVEVTIFDCSIVETYNVFEYDMPPDLGNDTTLCIGESLLLDVTTEGAGYTWQDNSRDPTFLVTEEGLYQVTVTVANCVYTDEIQVNFVAPPVVDLGDDMLLCGGSTLVLDATTPNATYAWQDQSTGAQFVVTEPGTYAVTVDVGGCTAEDEITIDYFYPDPVDLGSDITLCAGESLFLDVYRPGATYEWQDQSTESSFNVVIPGIYSVTVTVDDCTVTDEIEVSFIPGIQVDLGADSVLCPGASLTLDAFTPGATYEWQDHSTTSTYQVNTSGMYVVEVTVDNCVAKDTIDILFVDNQSIDLGPDTIVCAGGVLVLDAHTNGATYQWQDQSTADTLMVSNGGQYWVNISVNGCMAADTINVEYINLPSIQLGNDSTLCANDTIVLIAEAPNATYTWQDQSTSDTLLVSQPGTYWVVVSQQQCSDTDTILIHYNIVDPVFLGEDTTLCTGSTLILNPGNSTDILEWQDQSTATTYLVSAAGVYWVTASEGNCSITDSIHVDYLSLLSISLGPDTTLCNQESIALDATLPGATYEWQDQSTWSTYTATQAGSYWVNVHIGDCEASDTIEIGYATLPPPDLGPDTSLCEGGTLLLSAFSPGSTYQWQDNSTASDYLVAQPGSYAVTISNGICEASDTAVISFLSVPHVNLGNDTTLCDGNSFLLNANTAGSTYVWQDQSTAAGFLVTTPGIYHVLVSDGQCSASDTIQVSYLAISTIHLGNDTLLCAGETLTLQTDTPGAQYLWQDNSTGSTFDVTSPGLYWVMVSAGVCSAGDSIEIDFTAPVQVNLGPDTSLCPGETLILDAANSGATFEWNDQSTLQTYLVTTPGSYHVVVEVLGCYSSDTVVVDQIDLPYLSLGPDTTLCEGQILLLDAEVPDGMYLWHDQSNDPTYLVSLPGSYAVQLNIGNCFTADTIIVGYTTAVNVDLGTDRTICKGETVLLDPGIQETVDYLWQDQTTSSTYLLDDDGVYWLQVTDACGTSSDTISVFTEDCECSLYMPNVFSPNGDFVNDLAVPFTACALKYYHLQIFDRAGGLLYETLTPGEGWNGVCKGKEAQSGVYVFVLIYSFDDKKKQVLYGDISLIK